MLLREKVVLLLLVTIGYLYFIDQLTPWGNQLWEAREHNFSRFAVAQNGKTGFINSRGRLVIPLIYQDGVDYVAHDPILVKKDGLWGLVNGSEEPVAPFKYPWVSNFSNGLAIVAAKKPYTQSFVYGFINEKGNEVIPLKYQQARNFSAGGFAAVRKDFQWGYINKYGEMMILPRFQEALDFHEGLAAVKLKGRWGYIDFGGQIVIEVQFQEAGDFSKGLAPVKQQGRWGYIDTKGHWKVEPSYMEAHALSAEGLGMVKSDKFIGFIDHNGVLQFSSDRISQAKDFSEGLAAVEIKGDLGKQASHKWGFIDTKGQIIINPIFDFVSDFKGGLARVGMDKNDIRRGYLNKQGYLIWDPADWQTTFNLKRSIYQIIFVALNLYIIILLRYLFWRKELDKTSTGTKKPHA